MRSGYEDIETVIHVGAFTPINGSEANNWTGSNSNITNTDHLLKAKMPNLKKIIFISTIDVYGEDEIISELTTLSPVSLYGLSKLYCEKMIKLWAVEKGMNFKLLRIGHVYGQEEDDKISKINSCHHEKGDKGESVQIWGSGNEIRSFIYIEDVIRAIQRSLHLEEINEPINTCWKSENKCK